VKPAVEIGLLIVIMVIITIGIEATTRRFILPKSRIESRTAAEYKAAAAIKSSGESRTLLLLGNSLLGQGVEMNMLETLLPPGWKAKRLLIEDTSFFDWYYGMRRLFSIGSDPDAIALMLSVRQLTSSKLRGEYSAYHLLNRADLPELGSVTQMHPTAVSNLFFGNVSAFYGTRVEIRKQVLGLLIPDFADITKLIIPAQSPGIEESLLERKLHTRFLMLRKLAESKSIKLALIVAPESRLRNDTLNDVWNAAGASTLDVLVPIKPDMIIQSEFSDGFHLNKKGATRFTRALALELRPYLSGDGNTLPIALASDSTN
jgi:hypothetical protein